MEEARVEFLEKTTLYVGEYLVIILTWSTSWAHATLSWSQTFITWKNRDYYRKCIAVTSRSLSLPTDFTLNSQEHNGMKCFSYKLMIIVIPVINCINLVPDLECQPMYLIEIQNRLKLDKNVKLNWSITKNFIWQLSLINYVYTCYKNISLVTKIKSHLRKILIGLLYCS